MTVTREVDDVCDGFEGDELDVAHIAGAMLEPNTKLEPLLLLARSQKGAAAAKIAADATSTPGVYVFGELLQLSNIQELQNDPSHAKAYLLLRLFAYGTLQTYKADADSYPPLSPIQLSKLKHLTLVSLAMQNRSLEYRTLSAALDITSVRELEDTIIDVIYAGLIGGKMYHQEQVLHVDWVAGRDVSPEELARVAGVLDGWCGNAQNLLSALDERISEVRADTYAYAQAEDAYKALRETEYAAVVASTTSKKSARDTRGNAFGGAQKGQDSDIDMLDFNDPMGGGAARGGRRTRGQGHGHGQGQGMFGRFTGIIGGDEMGKRGNKRTRE